jgi:hypothetical protein
MKWVIPRSNEHFAGFDSPAVFDLTTLASEVQESLHCRICHQSVAAGDWAWQRLESKAHAILNPDGVVQLGVKFECIYCNAIHLAVPLPRHKGRGNGSLWASDDPGVDLVVRSLPSWNEFTRKAVSGLTTIANEAAFDVGTASVAQSNFSWTRPRPLPCPDADRRGGRSNQVFQCQAAKVADPLGALSSTSVATVRCADACCNCANGATASSAPATGSPGFTASATPTYTKRTPPAAAGLPSEERDVPTNSPYTPEEQTRRKRYACCSTCVFDLNYCLPSIIL